MLTKLVAIISLYKLGKTQGKKSSNPCGNKADLYLPIKKRESPVHEQGDLNSLVTLYPGF